MPRLLDIDVRLGFSFEEFVSPVIIVSEEKLRRAMSIEGRSPIIMLYTELNYLLHCVWKLLR